MHHTDGSLAPVDSLKIRKKTTFYKVVRQMDFMKATETRSIINSLECVFVKLRVSLSRRPRGR